MQKKSFESGSVIKSKFSRPLLVFLGAAVFTGLFICSLPLRDKFTWRAGLGLLVPGVIQILIIGIWIWRSARKVLIDRGARTITFRNLVTKKEVVYHFDELDGFVQVYLTQKNGDKIKVVYLVKDRKFCEKISGFVYSNLDELEGALASLKFLGVQRLNLAKRIAILRKRPVKLPHSQREQGTS